MKMFRKTQDGVMDNLLRVHRAQHYSPDQVCREFDPDLANAYIEHKLTVPERSRYEEHLSVCASCRRSVVGLARMVEPETIAYPVDYRPLATEAQPGWLAGVKRAFGAMTAPQWAIAAATALVLAVSVPLLLSRNNARSTQQAPATETAQSQAPKAAPNAVVAEERSSASPANSNAPALGQAPATPPLASPDSQATPGRHQSVAAGQTASEPTLLASNESLKKTDQPHAEKPEVKSEATGTDEAAARSRATGPVQAAAQPSPSQQARDAERQLPKISPEEARRQKEKDSADMKVLVPGRADGDQRAGERAIRPEDSVPPPPPSTSTTRARGGRLADDSARSMQKGGSLKDTVRPPRTDERKVSGKKFWLRDQIWTDKDYNPDKDMPIVTVIRDSQAYKDLLAKHSRLKSYFAEFDEKAQVIVVYKGIAYKLVPQQ